MQTISGKSIKPKKESKPSFVKGELAGHYAQTDLEYAFVLAAIKTIAAYKMIDISVQTTEAWYLEMLRQGWTKTEFLKRVEAIKKAEVYNRIDWSDWLKTETVYTRAELERMFRDRNNKQIQQGQRLLELMEKGYILTEEEKTACRLAASKAIEFEFSRQRAEAIQETEDNFKAKKRREIAIKKTAIMKLDNSQRHALNFELTEQGILTECKTSQELHIQIKYLEYFANLIPAEILNKYMPESNKQTQE